mgnify:FL=1|tara:strand:+ start:303 stop:500 length:198 start_codon:yes stop_codon:yes gene_type:complete
MGDADIRNEELLVIIGKMSSLLDQEDVPGNSVVERVGVLCSRNLALRREVQRLKGLLNQPKESAK